MAMKKGGSSSGTSSISQKVKSPLHFHWFRNQDLRLHDNPALFQSIVSVKRNSGKQGGGPIKRKNDISSGIVPIYCIDPRFVGATTITPFGSVKCSARRAKFLLESVVDLRKSLEENGSGLVVACGKPEEVFDKLMNAINDEEGQSVLDDTNVAIPQITCQQEVASEELAIDKAIKRMFKNGNGALESVWGSTLYDPDDLPFNDGIYGMPDVFTPFRNKVEKKCKIGRPLPTPSRRDLSLPKSDTLKTLLDGKSPKSIPQCSLSYIPTLQDLGFSAEDIQEVEGDNPGVMNFVGGESHALHRLKDYIWDKDLLKVYFDTRNGMLGADYSTKFSPWLAHGCLSPRYIAQECRRYEEERVQNKSTYWVVFELLWRDFFKFFAEKQGNKIFFLDGTLGKEAHGSHVNSRRWGLDKRQLEAWKTGKTGYPLVDANMRELAASGFMSNRGRQNVASFLTIDMNTDWRYGADHFESLLLDYDVYSNWGNWCSAAGMTGGRLNRFNIVKQSKDYDANGDYVRYWCPELADLPNNLIHEPWKMTKEQQTEFDVRLGVDYPNPIVTPTSPNPYNKGNKGRGGGGKKNNNGRNRNNPNRGRNQRQDMKSLKQGNFEFS